MTAIARARGLAAKIDAATPAHRDRTVDALRALAIAGVILGHWLVTALVVTPGRAGIKPNIAKPVSARCSTIVPSFTTRHSGISALGSAPIRRYITFSARRCFSEL